MSHVIVVGSGFAGLWAALGAARRLDQISAADGSVDVTVLSAKPFHDIRVRNYEPDLTDCRIPLARLLDPVGVGQITAEVTGIDTVAQTVRTADGAVHRYDRLVLASGSHVVEPDIPGLSEFGFDVDTYDGATALDRHLHELAAQRPELCGRAETGCPDSTVVVVGAGLTGIETACELPARLTALFGDGVTPRVVVVDHNPEVGSDMGSSARPVIEAALSDNGVEAMTGVSVTKVDDYLRVVGVPSVFAAGDVAAARMDDEQLSVMSCQHGRPMGRYAGYNVIGDLLGEPMLALRIPWYVTVLDLGPAGAVYTEGWDRQLAARGASAKATKQEINTRRIYPPLNGDRTALLAAAAPDLQQRPELGY